MVVLDGIAKRLAFLLRSKGNNRRGAATGCRACAGVEVIGHFHRSGHGLVKVAVRIDAAWGDDSASRIDCFFGRGQIATHHNNLSVFNADVGVKRVGGGGDASVSNDEVKCVRHARSFR